MLSLDLFDSRYEKRLHEGALDDTITRTQAHLMEPLSRRAADIRTQIRSGKLSGAQLDKLEKEYEDLVQKRLDIMLDRQPKNEQQVPSKQDPFAYVKPEPKGIGDTQDPRQKMAQLAQRTKKGPLANVAAGIKAFVKGEPEPMDEAAEDSKISIARYVYAQIMNALENNSQFATIQWPQGTMQGPKQDATLSRNQMHFLIQRLVSMSREQRKQFTQRVLADRVATLQWLTNKKIKPAPTMPQPEVPAGQMDLGLPKPVGEARGQKKNSNKVDSPTAPNAEVQNRLRKLRAQYPSAVNDVEALVQDEMATQARVDQTLGQQQAEIQQQGSALAQLNQVNQQQDSKITSLQQQLATAVRDLQQPATKPTVATSTTATTQPAPVADKPTSVPEPIYIPEPVTAKDQEIYNKVRDLETELDGKIDAMASWNTVAQNDPQANNELEALRKEVERTRTELQRQVKKLKKQVKKHANSLPAIDQVPVRNMGTVRRVATTPQLGQTPTDAGELGRQIGQRAQANKQAKYGKKPTAATPTDLDFIDTDQANQYLSRFAKNKQNATTVEPRQKELEIVEGTAEQFGQAVRQADQTGRELERDPEWRRLQQQKKQREKNKLRSQAGYGNDADEFGDIIDMNETVKKLQQGDPITVTAPNEFEGATGEIYDFSPSRTFVIVDLYNHGKHSMHLSDVEYNQYAADQDDDELDEGAMSELDIERQDLDRMTDPQFLKAYGISKEFWKYKNQALLKKPRRRPMSAQLARSPVGQKMNTMYGSNCPGCGRSTNPDRCICESEMKEGWSDAIVARRLGTPRTPYSVYIKGKKWKDFKNDDLARAVADKLKAKFKADGRDPETITIAPTDMSEGITETVVDVKAGMAQIYRRLAPKIERHRDSFLAGQLYDELENYAELHGAEREFKQMMNGARNRAHMEYDTNPGGFHNWFWFLPFADDTMTESTDDIKKRMSKLKALALAANRAGDDAKCKRYQQKIQSLKQKLSQSMNEFDASGYDRYSIYIDDYDLEEKFSDLDDAVDAIKAYKRDDPKSRYADYNVRDLNGKVVWRNDTWQDTQKPGKIQFLPPKTETIDSQANTNAGSPKDSPMTQQQWMQSIKQQYPGVKFAQNKTTMQIFAMAPGKGKVGTFDPRQQVTEFQVADLVRPGAQTDTPPRRAYSIALQGRPGKDFIAEHAWDALQSVFPREYPVNSDAAEQKVAEVTKRGSAIVKTGIASEDIADSYVAKLAAKRVPAQCWKIIGGELEEATGDDRFDSMMNRISNDPWTRLNADPNWEYEIEELVDRHIEPWLLAMERSGMPITRDNETLNPGWRKRYEQVANKLAQEFLTSRGLNPRDPDLLGKIRFAIDSHTDQSRNVAGQLSAYSELPLARYAGDFDADGQTANIRDAMVGFIRTDDDDADEPPTRPRPDADPRRLDPGNIEESSKPGEYYIHTVYFKDGTKKRIRVTSDEVDVADYYTKRGKAVDRVDYDFQIHSDMTEGLKSTLAGAALAGAMALGGAGAVQAQSASGGPNLVNATTIIQQIQAGKIQNQNDLASALGNASNKQAVFKILQNKAGLPGHGADSVINALGGKSSAGAQQPAAGAQPTVKSAGQSGSIVQRPTDNFEGRIKEEFGMPGTTIPRKSVIQGFTVFYNPKTRLVSITRGGDSEEAAIEQARIGTPSLKNFRLAADRLITKIESDLNEAKEIVTKNDFLDRRDYLLRMISADSNSANKQIIRAEIRKLESQAETEGWITMQQRMVREDSDSGEAVEMAIMRRMLVAHTDLIIEFGLDKVVQAIEEVAYNVGDTDEIGSSDVSGWVRQVKQILGADA